MKNKETQNCLRRGKAVVIERFRSGKAGFFQARDMRVLREADSRSKGSSGECIVQSFKPHLCLPKYFHLVL